MINFIKNKLTDDSGNINRKKTILFSFLILFSLLSFFSLARYAHKEIKNYFLRTKNFYFNCDKLSEKGSNIEMTNWSGVGQYQVTFFLNSYANSYVKSEDDIEYDIEYSCSDNVICNIVDNKTNGNIPKETNVDDFTIVINVPSDTILQDKDVVELNVEATSTKPFVKKISGVFRLVVGHYGLSYEIEDTRNSPYLILKNTNTLDYYIVRESINGYDQGAQIDIDTYQSLSAADKEKCASSIITLNFDPHLVLLDMTSEVYANATDVQTVMIDGHEYVSSISFKIDAMSSNNIKFYKVNTSRNYTYPGNGNDSVIQVEYS